MYAFYQVLFDMLKNEDVMSEQVKVKRNIDASCCSGVILGKMLLMLKNFLCFPKLKSASISYGESRSDRWASNSVITSVSTILTTIFLKPLRNLISIVP